MLFFKKYYTVITGASLHRYIITSLVFFTSLGDVSEAGVAKDTGYFRLCSIFLQKTSLSPTLHATWNPGLGEIVQWLEQWNHKTTCI